MKTKTNNNGMVTVKVEVVSDEEFNKRYGPDLQKMEQQRKEEIKQALKGVARGAEFQKMINDAVAKILNENPELREKVLATYATPAN